MRGTFALSNTFFPISGEGKPSSGSTGYNTEIGIRIFIFIPSNKRTEELGRAKANELTELGPGKAVFYACDVTNESQVKVDLKAFTC